MTDPPVEPPASAAAPGAARRALLQAVLLAALVLAGLEGAARFVPEPEGSGSADGTPSGPAMAQTLPGNPHLLWELAPGTWPVEGGTAHINALGMRDAERGPKARPRALVVGDSSVFGFGVDQDELFTSLLEDRMGADVVNAGVPGWSSLQARNMLALRGLSLEPDLLVIATLWSDNNFDQFVDAEVLAQVETGGAVRAVLEQSALFRLVDRLAGAGGAQTIATVADRAPVAGRRRVPLQRYAENLEAMAQALHDRGGGVAFVMLANRMDVQRRPGPLVWQPYRDAMRQVAARWGAPLVDLPARFPHEGGQRLFLDDIHPNAQGHAVMARLVEAALSEAGWPATPLRQTPPTGPLPRLEDPYEGQGVALDLVEPARGGPGSGGAGPPPGRPPR